MTPCRFLHYRHHQNRRRAVSRPPSDQAICRCIIHLMAPLHGDSWRMSASNEERRAAPRRKSFLGAILSSKSGTLTWDCQIRNFSAGGARVRLDSDSTLPRECVLIDLPNARAYEASIEWARPPNYGINFLKAHDLRGDLEPKLLFAKKLWLARWRRHER